MQDEARLVQPVTPNRQVGSPRFLRTGRLLRLARWSRQASPPRSRLVRSGAGALPRSGGGRTGSRFAKYCQFNAAVERLWSGARCGRGPPGSGTAGICSSATSQQPILRWTEETGEVSVFRSPSTMRTVTRRRPAGTADQLRARLTTGDAHRTDGRITVLMDRYQGKRLNAPNDAVVHSNGSLWFTDPGYGDSLALRRARGTFELPTHVYRLDPDSGQATVVASDMARPNGLCFSPDEHRLYIIDTGQPHGKANPSVCSMCWTARRSRTAGCFVTWAEADRTESVAMWTGTSGPSRLGRGRL